MFFIKSDYSIKIFSRKFVINIELYIINLNIFKKEVFILIPLPLYNMSYLTNKYKHMSKIEVPKKVSEKSRIVSRGTLNIFEGKNLEKFVQMTIKGLNIYHYDFGIAYPANSATYPVFLYQIISAPKRVLVVVNYAFYKKDEIDRIKGFDNLLQLDLEHSDMLIKTFQPQDFLVDDVIPNAFNGLVRTTEIDKAYERVFNLFENWYEGIELNIESKKEDAADYNQWLSNFKEKFYRQDYGFTAAKKFLGEKWSREVFENYLFC